jgi:hypothetical protein
MLEARAAVLFLGSWRLVGAPPRTHGMTDIPWASSRRLFSPSVREDDIAMGEGVVRLRGSLGASISVPSHGGWAKPLQELTESLNNLSLGKMSPR